MVTAVLLAVVGGAAYIAYLSLAKKESAGIPGVRPPIAIRIGDGSPQVIAPGRYLSYTVNIPDRTCTLSGRVEGVSGGNRDFEAFILDDVSRVTQFSPFRVIENSPPRVRWWPRPA